MITTETTTEPRRELPRGWRLEKLAAVCELNPRRPTFQRNDETPTTFVPMPAVDENSGTITAPEVRPFGEVKKGYTYFAEDDVLFAKITPCMQNGKHAIACNLIDGVGFGSTEFHVIRPGSQVLPEWIHFFLRQPVVLKAAEVHFTGSVGQQRVPDEYLANLTLPLPPLPEQRRIAMLLGEQMAAVERARAAAGARLAAARALPAAYLREVFEGEEARGWPVAPMGTVGEIGSGVTLGRRFEGVATRRVPYLRVANVKDGFLDLSDVYEVAVPESDIKKCRLQRGDLLLTEGGDPDKLGRGSFWQEQLPECIHQNHIFRVRFDLSRHLPDFLSAQLGSSYGKAYFLAHAKQTTGIATINQRVLAGFPLMIPPLAVQERVVGQIATQLRAAETAIKVLQAQSDDLNSFPAALLRQAFSGEL